MSQNSNNHSTKYDYLILIPILALAFYIALIPKEGYPYLIHIDEWVHMAFSKAMLASGNTIVLEPFYGDRIIGLADNMENGFQVFWGVFQQISGLQWLMLIRYAPSFIFVLTVFSVFIMARRQGFGWEAAFFTCLIITNVGIMGPAIFIPVSLALVFLPLSLFIAFYCRGIWSYFLLFIFSAYLISIHGPSAICVVLIFIPYMLSVLTKNFRHGLGVTLAIIGPFIITLPLTYELAFGFIGGLLQIKPPMTGHDLPRIIMEYGYLPVITSIFGVICLIMKGNREKISLAAGLPVILAMLAAFHSAHYGIGIVYLRGMLFALLMISIVAGAGLHEIRTFDPFRYLRTKSMPVYLRKGIGIILCLVLVGFTLTIAIPDRQETPFYRMINTAEYEAFTWIEQNVGADYEKAILHPWTATAFTAITGKYVYTRIHNSADAKDESALKYLKGGCTDTTYLIDRGISIVYTTSSVNNPDLIKVRENVYLLSDNLTPSQ